MLQHTEVSLPSHACLVVFLLSILIQ